MEHVREPEAAAYQVFVNHRGPDTKRNIASLIYHRLTNCHGLRVFLDMEELRTGNTVYPAIKRAIDSATVHIALFSQRYAESRPCLDELCWMLRSSHQRTLIPVFCDVEPCHLKGIDRPPYADAFAKHQLKVDAGKVEMEVMQGWKRALREAADISGLVFKRDESDHGKFLEDIVEKVLKAIIWDPLDVATYPVGLAEATVDFQNKVMTNESELNATKIVVIAGMGGIGKSTLAKHLYNVKRSGFSRSCYLSDSREKDLSSLQEKLVRDLLGYEVRIPNIGEGKRILGNGLRGLPVLVIFDDVADKEKIKGLLDMDAVEAGSLILITSRDKYILRGSSVNTFLYDVKPLKRKHAQELFCRHAFRQSIPLQGYETLVKEFLKFCGGLPLCLQHFGEHLSANRNIQYWMPQLNRYFCEGLPLLEADGLINKLIWSYNDLNTEQKEMFLDVGCFLVGEDTELAIRVLEGLGLHNCRGCLESLHQKCLLDIRSDVEFEHHSCLPNVLSKGYSKIIMHEQLKELARHIARKDFNDKTKPLRVSCAFDIQQMKLQAALDQYTIRGIRIPKGQDPPPLDKNVGGLRLMVVEQPISFSTATFLSWWTNFVSFKSSSAGWSSFRVSGDLVWLRLGNCDLKFLPLTILFRNLRVLEVAEGFDSNLTFLRDKHTIEGYPQQLQEFKIQFPAGTTQSFLQQWVDGTIKQSTNLNKLELKNNTDMLSFPIEFSNLTNLRYLDLSGCTNLTSLPKSFSKCLGLQYLALRECRNLSIPTDFLGEISTLEYVDFGGCSQLVQLPTGMAYQSSLKCLDLRDTRVSRLPENLQLLGKLEELRLGSPLLTELPLSFGEMLVINNRRFSSSHMQVEAFPSSLVKLMLVNCGNLKALRSLSNLVNLKFLSIFSCQELDTVDVEGLIQLEEFLVYGCPKLRRIEALSQRERLNCLGISTYNENEIIRNDFLQFLASPSQISTAIFSTTTVNQKIEFEEVVRRALSDIENSTIIYVPATTTCETPVKVENLHSFGAILMCFIPCTVSFHVRFEADNSSGEYLEYRSENGTESDMLDIFMWTEDSKLFDYENFCNNVTVYCSSHDCASRRDPGHGLIVTLPKKEKGLEIFKQFMVELRSVDGT